MRSRILVVDDEPDVEQLVLQKFRKQIREGSLVFDFARNGLEALRKLDEDRSIGLILTDINMPEMDGLTLLQKIEDLENPALKAVIVSAYGDMENIRRAMNYGAFDFITKPIDFNDLEITIAKTLKHLEMIERAREDHQKLVAVQQDLAIASRIQLSILPRVFPPFPERKEFALYAAMTPTKEVGGDFYDFFFIDGERLALVVGDVSGKGVPAAIFMAMCRTLLKALAQQVVNPGECLRRLNTILASEGDTSMFVTIFYGVLNTRTGELQYSSAAHPAPCLHHADGNVELLEQVGGTLIGMMPNLEYDVKRIALRRGDTLFLYTDGVTEVMNESQDLFAENRLLECLKQSCGYPLEELTRRTFQELNAFGGKEIHADDITMLVARYFGPP